MFSALTVINMALRVETDGGNTYLAASNAVNDTELKDLFRFLAEQEEAHKKKFGGLKKAAKQ